MSSDRNNSQSRTVPAFGGNVSFNAQHSPMGAFMSFTLGQFGSGGGVGVEIGKPAAQNVFVGVKRGDRKSRQPIRCLPFSRTSGDMHGAANYEIGQAPPPTAEPNRSYQPYAASEIRRHYGWATDSWVTEDFTFTLYTPFGPIPEPGTDDLLRNALLPAVTATLTIDNRRGKQTRTGVFAIDFVEPGTRVLRSDGRAAAKNVDRLGFGWRRSVGVLGTIEHASDDDVFFAFQRWSVAEGISDINPIHELGSIGGLAFEVPAGEIRTLTLALGVYLDGIVTTGLDGRYYYTRSYAGLDDVLGSALDRADELRTRAAALDAELLGSGLSPDQQFLIAHATRSYYGSTQLLDVGGEPFFIVNEGEYCMMNTLDLSVDHVFWELKQNPWVVRNILASFVHRYSYHDQLQGSLRDAKGKRLPGGISFCHDMGVNNNFSLSGHSSYELAHLGGCFSYMTQEQLCNWSLLASCCFAETADAQWLRQNAGTLRACLQSMINRGGSCGFAQYDSARCRGGQEITTYDSLDHSLAQTRNNVYIATKCWATYLGLALLLRNAGDETEATRADEMAARVAAVIAERAQQSPDGVIPAVFEAGNPGFTSRILPACEALIYALHWERTGLLGQTLPELAATPSVKPMFDALRRHTELLLTDPQQRNYFPDGGIRLSSTSNNSWASKIAILQHVVRRVYQLDHSPAIASAMTRADAAHVKWQTDGSGYWACSDQFVNGEAKGSRYYPRIITTALWLDPVATDAAPPLKRSAPQASAK